VHVNYASGGVAHIEMSKGHFDIVSSWLYPVGRMCSEQTSYSVFLDVSLKAKSSSQSCREASAEDILMLGMVVDSNEVVDTVLVTSYSDETLMLE
jgi:hypothetical protein